MEDHRPDFYTSLNNDIDKSEAVSNLISRPRYYREKSENTPQVAGIYGRGLGDLWILYSLVHAPYCRYLYLIRILTQI